jgi:hypothetical protein
MSLRITRASARKAASSSELSAGTSAPAVPVAASSTRPLAASRKRKAPVREPSPAPEQEPAKAPSSRHNKRQKVSEPDRPPPAPAAPTRRRKAKGPAAMSSPGYVRYLFEATLLLTLLQNICRSFQRAKQSISQLFETKVEQKQERWSRFAKSVINVLRYKANTSRSRLFH